VSSRREPAQATPPCRAIESKQWRIRSTSSARCCAAGATGPVLRSSGCPSLRTGGRAGSAAKSSPAFQLERGRASAPSPDVLTALARALRLTEAEREHLFQLAGQLVPAEKRIRTTLPHSVRRLVEQLSASPAAVCDVGWNPIAWNAMWSAAIGDPLERPDRERNIAWRHFTGLHTRVVRARIEQREFEEAVVADLRSSLGRYPDDQRLAQLIADLREASARFRSLWQARRVGVYEQERKTIDHPQVGALQVDCDILTTHRNDLRVVVYTAAPGSRSAKALEELTATCADKLPLTGLP
jgi:hypothetical protein